MSVPTLIDTNGRPLRAGALFGSGSGFEGAGSNRQQTRTWSTGSMSASGETIGARRILSARARDLVRNNGKARGAELKQIERVVGNGLRFQSVPDASLLGVAPLDALSFGREIEREIKRWGSGYRPECDLGRDLTWGQLQRVLYADRFTAGENTAIVRWRPDRDARYATCVQLVDPERLSNPNDQSDRELMRQGVEFNQDGEAIGYHFRDYHPNDPSLGINTYTWSYIPRTDEHGWPRVIHGFSATRSEQVRGISAFASILLAFRDVQRFSEAELGAAIINALLTAFVKSNFDPVAISEALGIDAFDLGKGTQSWQDTRLSMLPESMTVGDNEMLVMPPGDTIEINNSARNTAGFDSFVQTMDQGMAAALGMDYPSFSGNLEGVNYSSYRGGLLDAWRTITGERFEFESDTLVPILTGLIMESFERGILIEPEGFPSFEDNVQAYMAGSFIGPGRGTVDPVKEAQGALIDVEAGFKSRSAIAAERGENFEETLDQIAIDKKLAEDRGLKLADLYAAGAIHGDPQE